MHFEMLIDPRYLRGKSNNHLSTSFRKGIIKRFARPNFPELLHKIMINIVPNP